MIRSYYGIIFNYKSQNTQKVTPTSIEHFAIFETQIGAATFYKINSVNLNTA